MDISIIYQSGLANAAMGFKIFWMFFTCLLWGSFCYTGINIPYGSMASAISADPNDRAQLSTWRTIGATLAGTAIGVGIPWRPMSPWMATPPCPAPA